MLPKEFNNKFDKLQEFQNWLSDEKTRVKEKKTMFFKERINLINSMNNIKEIWDDKYEETKLKMMDFMDNETEYNSKKSFLDVKKRSISQHCPKDSFSSNYTTKIVKKEKNFDESDYSTTIAPKSDFSGSLSKAETLKLTDQNNKINYLKEENLFLRQEITRKEEEILDLKNNLIKNEEKNDKVEEIETIKKLKDKLKKEKLKFKNYVISKDKENKECDNILKTYESKMNEIDSYLECIKQELTNKTNEITDLQSEKIELNLKIKNLEDLNKKENKNFYNLKIKMEEILINYSNQLGELSKQEQFYGKIVKENEELKLERMLLIKKLNKKIKPKIIN